MNGIPREFQIGSWIQRRFSGVIPTIVHNRLSMSVCPVGAIRANPLSNLIGVRTRNLAFPLALLQDLV
jgi:hypothetical protein